MTRGVAFEDAGEDLDAVCFLAGGDQVALARAASVQFSLDGLQVEGQPGLEAVEDDTYRQTMALAEGLDAEGAAEGGGGVEQHVRLRLHPG